MSEAIRACAREPTRARLATGGHDLRSRQADEFAAALVEWAAK